MAILKTLPNNSIDCIVTDPPYGYSFMGKDWDKIVPLIEVWKECLRILKDGSFCFVMSAPRQDILSQMIIRLSEAGFDTGFTSIYWTYGQGFPKALNITKALCKRYEISKSQMCKLWQTIIHQTKCISEDKGNDRWYLQVLLENLQQESQCQIINQLSAGKEIQISERQRQSIMEGWNNLLQKEGKLSRCKVCKMPTGILTNGKERWICYGTQINNGTIYWKIIKEDGSCASFESQCERQSFEKLEIICESCRTQEVGNLQGAYGGLQVKPAVEIIIVCMKPLNEKTYVEQALKNGKGITWLDTARIPFDTNNDKDSVMNIRHNQQEETMQVYGKYHAIDAKGNTKGRFPANLLVSDDILNNRIEYTSGWRNSDKGNDVESSNYSLKKEAQTSNHYGDKGSFSRYFDLDKWWIKKIEELPEEVKKTYPFIITPKASKSERNKGLENIKLKEKFIREKEGNPNNWDLSEGKVRARMVTEPQKNYHPTVKPLKLMSYLITLGSREGDIILDPYVGSGTTCLASKILNRQYIGIELMPEYCEIVKARVDTEIVKISKVSTNDETIKEAVKVIIKENSCSNCKWKKHCKKTKALNKGVCNVYDKDQ